MSTFHERQKSLFNQLKDAEEQYSFSKMNKVTEAPDYGVIDRHTYRKLKHEMKQFRGKESIFKREAADIRERLRVKSIPGYIKNPQKWVYYSLSDVTPEQMSDATNMATALACIKKMEELETANSNSEMETDQDTDENGIIFKKPKFRISTTVEKVEAPHNEKAVFKSNKIIMPEYVVGVSKKKENKTKVKKDPQDNPLTSQTTKLKLNHLYEEEDEE